MWGRRVGERGKRLREHPRDRAEELTSGPGRSGTERAGEARAGRRGCGSRPSERASGRDGPARGGRPQEGRQWGSLGRGRERTGLASERAGPLAVGVWAGFQDGLGFLVLGFLFLSISISFTTNSN